MQCVVKIFFVLENGNVIKIDSYKDIISSHPELIQLKDVLMKRVSKVIASAKEQQKAYMKHERIWTESRTEFMYYFLRYGRYLTADELGMLEDDETAVKKEEPSLEDFKGHIDNYEGLHEELKGMEHTKTWQVNHFVPV